MNRVFLVIILIFSYLIPYSVNASSSFLNSEENTWLKTRGDTIVVIPERNNPPFSFVDPTYKPQGIFIDYMKMVGVKLGLKVEFVTPRTRPDVIAEFEKDKKEYIGSLGLGKAKELDLLYNTPYLVTPIVIAVRNDYLIKKGVFMDDFNNKKVSTLADSATQIYIERNYPKVVLEKTIDNELALQKLVLGEVDAAVINLESLNYFMSSRGLSSSVKIAGNLPGVEISLVPVVSKNQAILNSIIEKGLVQITSQEREEIVKKWQQPSFATGSKNEIDQNVFFITISILLSVATILFFLIKSKKRSSSIKTTSGISLKEVKEKIDVLKHTNQELAKELDTIEKLEKSIEEQIETLK